MMLETDDCMLLIVDIQEKLLNATFNKETLIKKSEIITKVANILNIPVVITEQYPKGLGNTVECLKLGKEHVFEKTFFNALEEELVKDCLNKLQKKQILIMGIETHICVYQTAINLKELGYNVVVVRDASGSRNELEHNYALDVMKNNGVEIKTTEMIVFELLKHSKHPNFKEIQSLIK